MKVTVADCLELDAFAKARTMKQARSMMITAINQ